MLYTLNPEQIQRALALCWQAEQLAKTKGLHLFVPALIMGPTGTAKTASVRQFAERLGKASGCKVKLWTICPSTREASDIGGIPFPDSEHVKCRYLMPPDLPYLLEGENDPECPQVLLIDEADRAQDGAGTNVVARLFQDREIHGHHIPGNCFTIGTANGTSDSLTQDLSEHLRTRVCTLYASRHAAGFVRSFDQYAADAGLSPMIRAFAQSETAALTAEPPMEEIAACNWRTLVMADLLDESAALMKTSTDDIITACIAGVIGSAAAARWDGLKTLIRDAPPIEDILKDPAGTKIPDNASVQYALGCRLAERGRDDAKAVIAAATYLCRYPQPAMAKPHLDVLCNSHAGVVVTQPAVSEWIKKNRPILT